MGLTTQGIRAALDRVAMQMPSLEHELNAADGELGDGDTGVMLRRLVQKATDAGKTAPDDVGAAFKALAMASSSTTGSSLGTLITVALMTLSKSSAGESTVTWPSFGAMLENASGQMLARGGSALGDKTVVDMVHAVAGALLQLKPDEFPREKVLTTARATLSAFRAKPCRIGRARIFGDKSVGVDDPGMLALMRIVEAITR